MMIIYPILVFLFVLSILVISRFMVNLLSSMMSTPPKKYEFKDSEPTLYMVLISYIITFLIFI